LGIIQPVYTRRLQSQSAFFINNQSFLERGLCIIQRKVAKSRIATNGPIYDKNHDKTTSIVIIS